jgi:hypothetical protein
MKSKFLGDSRLQSVTYYTYIKINMQITTTTMVWKILNKCEIYKIVASSEWKKVK